MSSKVEKIMTAAAETTETKGEKQGAKPRVAALMALATLALGTATLARGVYYAFTDAWMAPITLSPENDAVLQINVKLNEQLVLREKLRADVERIDSDLKGIDVAVAKLKAIEDNAQETLRWSVFTTNAQTAATNDRMRALREQKIVLDGMLDRQREIAKTTKKNADAGLVAKQDFEREQQTLDQLQLGLVQNARDTVDTRAQSMQLFAMTGALKQATAKGTANGLLPEIAAGQERDARLGLELIKLDAEKRSLVSQREISVDTIKRMDDILKQLESRPLYRAVQAQTDVAFAPYGQVEDMANGSPIVACKWLLFRCEVVGRVAEILPGEAVAQDPWNNQARGQYAILALDNREAAKEKVLRARKPR